MGAPGWPSAGAFCIFLILIGLAYLGSFLLGLLFKLVQFRRQQLERQDDATATSDVSTGTGNEDRDKNRKRSTSTLGKQRVLQVIQYIFGFCILLIFHTGIVHLWFCVVAGAVLGMLINMCRRRRESIANMFSRLYTICNTEYDWGL